MLLSVTYLPGRKSGVLRHKTQIVHTHLVRFFEHMRLDEIRQSDVDAFARIELRSCERKTVNNRLAVLSTMLAVEAGLRVGELRGAQ